MTLKPQQMTLVTHNKGSFKSWAEYQSSLAIHLANIAEPYRLLLQDTAMLLPLGNIREFCIPKRISWLSQDTPWSQVLRTWTDFAQL
tara:strand:- start:2386 stop:2646 length:261 start_codon:yes stop_codon:yes gene_type:complete